MTGTSSTARHDGGRRDLENERLAGETRERILRSERLVYLFPTGFDPAAFLEDPPLGEDLLLTEIEFEYPTAPHEGAVSVSALRTFIGWLSGEPFAIEVRERSVTIVAEPFWARRDLLLAVKERVDEIRDPARRREEAA